MKRRLILLLAVIFFIAISTQKAFAYVKTADVSALEAVPLVKTPFTLEQTSRAAILRSYLKQYHSPLADHADSFIKEADANHLDWKMVAAIAGVESYFGQMIPPDSYNAWGYNVYGNNVRRFTSWDNGIAVVSYDLRHIYMNQRGATTIYQIGATYAADPAWASKVQHFMDAIDQYSKRFTEPTLSISF